MVKISVNSNLHGNIMVAASNVEEGDMLRSSLEGEGYGVYVCRSFDDISTLEHRNLKAVIVDVSENLTEMLHGIEFVKQSPTGVNVPILVASDSPSTDIIVSALNVGASDYIIKPFTSRELVIRLRGLIR